MNIRQENVIKILLEMFNERGYTNIKYHSERDLITANKAENDIIYAFTNIIPKLNVEEIHNHISILQKEDVYHGLIVYEGIPTSTVKKVLANTPDIKINIELFDACDLQFNITRHVLVPKHTKISKDEMKTFKEKFGTNIPILLRNDPVCRFYDFSKGDIIMITGRNGYITYRFVK